MSENFYCEYCGQKYASVKNLTFNTCSRHPAWAGMRKTCPSFISKVKRKWLVEINNFYLPNN